jgi:hypothetical protein
MWLYLIHLNVSPAEYCTKLVSVSAFLFQSDSKIRREGKSSWRESLTKVSKVESFHSSTIHWTLTYFLSTENGFFTVFYFQRHYFLFRNRPGMTFTFGKINNKLQENRQLPATKKQFALSLSTLSVKYLFCHLSYATSLRKTFTSSLYLNLKRKFL